MGLCDRRSRGSVSGKRPQSTERDEAESRLAIQFRAEVQISERLLVERIWRAGGSVCVLAIVVARGFLRHHSVLPVHRRNEIGIAFARSTVRR